MNKPMAILLTILVDIVWVECRIKQHNEVFDPGAVVQVDLGVEVFDECRVINHINLFPNLCRWLSRNLPLFVDVVRTQEVDTAEMHVDVVFEKLKILFDQRLIYSF